MRKMATVRKIDAVDSIPGADAIEVATVGGWKVVVVKGEFSVGDLAVYVEVDSWIPTELAPFLSNGKEPRIYNGVLGERLRTVKLRGQISQGLLLPLDSVFITDIPTLEDDVSDLLRIQKWEAPIPACLAGEIRGLFPTSVPKTDQPRIQNLTEEFASFSDLEWEITEKADGSSCTFFLDPEGELHVCSRNLDLKPSETNTFWQMAYKYNIKEKMLQMDMHNMAIQGELIGEGVQGNPYKIQGQDFIVFDIYNANKQEYVSATLRQEGCDQLDLKHVPVMSQTSIKGLTMEDLLSFAEGKSVVSGVTEREGLVFKCITDPSISFKCISNKFLLKYGG